MWFETADGSQRRLTETGPKRRKSKYLNLQYAFRAACAARAASSQAVSK